MDSWLKKYEIQNGKEFAPNIFYKYEKGQWFTVDENGKIVQIIDVSESSGPCWGQYVESNLATQYRSEMLKTFMRDICKCEIGPNILVLSPSIKELEVLFHFSNDIYVTDAHESYLDVLCDQNNKIQLRKLGSIDLNVLCDIKRIHYVTNIISIMVINYIENPHQLLKVLKDKCEYLILGTWLMLGMSGRFEDENMTEYELDKIGGATFDWKSQIGMHCSTRGERWSWTEKYFINMLEQCGYIVMNVYKPQENCLFVRCRSC